MAETEFVTHRQWDSYAKRIERRNLRQFGRSLTFTGIACRANSYIVEIRSEGMIVRPGWRAAMQTEDEGASSP